MNWDEKQNHQKSHFMEEKNKTSIPVSVWNDPSYSADVDWYSEMLLQLLNSEDPIDSCEGIITLSCLATVSANLDWCCGLLERVSLWCLAMLPLAPAWTPPEPHSEEVPLKDESFFWSIFCSSFSSWCCCSSSASACWWFFSYMILQNQNASNP